MNSLDSICPDKFAETGNTLISRPAIIARTIIILPAIKSTDMHSMADSLGFSLKKSMEFCAETTKASFDSSISFGVPVEPDVLHKMLSDVSLSFDKKEFIFSF